MPTDFFLPLGVETSTRDMCAANHFRNQCPSYQDCVLFVASQQLHGIVAAAAAVVSCTTANVALQLLQHPLHIRRCSRFEPFSVVVFGYVCSASELAMCITDSPECTIQCSPAAVLRL